MIGLRGWPPLVLLITGGCVHAGPIPPGPAAEPRLLLVHGNPAPSAEVSLTTGAVLRTGPIGLYRDSAVWRDVATGTRVAVPLAAVDRIAASDPVRSWGLGVGGGVGTGIALALLLHNPEFVPLFGPLYAVPGAVIGMLAARIVPFHQDIFRPEVSGGTPPLDP